MALSTRQFIMTPGGRIVAVDRIADIGITDTGLIVSGSDSVIDFRKCSPEEAVSFRDELMHALRAYMAGRPLPRMSWDPTARQQETQLPAPPQPVEQQPQSEQASLRVLPGATG